MRLFITKLLYHFKIVTSESALLHVYDRVSLITGLEYGMER